MEKSKYIKGIGRRKNASALVHYYAKEQNDFSINGLNYKKYFPEEELQKIINQPLEYLEKQVGKIVAFIKGGGKRGQAQALSLALARVFAQLSEEIRKKLKKTRLLSCDSRQRERKKPGLKRARRAPQWSKR